MGNCNSKLVRTCNISTIHRTISFGARNFWNIRFGTEIIPSLENYFFRNFHGNFKILRKRRNNFFSTEGQKLSTLGNIFYFFVPYRWSTDLEILKVLTNCVSTWSRLQQVWPSHKAVRFSNLLWLTNAQKVSWFYQNNQSAK